MRTVFFPIHENRLGEFYTSLDVEDKKSHRVHVSTTTSVASTRRRPKHNILLLLY